MILRFVTLLAPALTMAGVPASAETASPPEVARVAIETEKGTITVDLDLAHAPLTSANFLRYAKEKRFDGTVFYRAMKLDWGTQPNGLIQGGTQANPQRNRAEGVPHEPTSQTGIRHKRGTISMARYAPGTAKGDFSIMVSAQPGLDAVADSPDPERAAGFAAFGQVASGMQIVDAIFAAPVSSTKGEGAMKGQMLDPQIRILTVRQVPIPEPEPEPEPAPPATPAQGNAPSD